MHGQTPHWIKNKDHTFSKGNLQTGEVEEVTVSVREDIVLQRHIRIAADRNICEKVVSLVDGFAHVLTARSMKALEKWKAKNASKTTQAQMDRVLENMKKKGLKANLIITADYPDDMPGTPEESNGNDG